MVAIATASPSFAVEAPIVRRIARQRKLPTPTERSDEIRRSLHALERPPLKTTDVEAYQAEMLRKYNGLRFDFGSLNRLAVALGILATFTFVASLLGLVIARLLSLLLPLASVLGWLGIVCMTSFFITAALYLACAIWGDPHAQPSNICFYSSYWTRGGVGSVSVPLWILDRVNALHELFPDLRFKVDHLEVSRKQLLPDPLLLGILPDDSVVYFDGWNLEREIERES